jgi:hypothetical protein
MSRFCPNCGTEVDDTAVFCPTCGQPIDQATESDLPAAPAWPEPPASEPAAAEPPGEPSEPVERPSARSEEAPPAWADEAAPPPAPPREDVTRVEAHPAAPVAGPPGTGRRAAAGPAINLPLTMPVTLSAWLIGIGALLAAIGIVIGLFDGLLNPIELILLLALIAIAAPVFFSARLPSVPNLRLATLAVALIGFGIALDRLSFSGAGVAELLLFLGTAMAALGALILELGRDQPLGGSR